VTNINLEIKDTKENCKRGTAKLEHLVKASETAVDNRVKKELDEFRQNQRMHS
jgi:hypothetical protein